MIEIKKRHDQTGRRVQGIGLEEACVTSNLVIYMTRVYIRTIDLVFTFRDLYGTYKKYFRIDNQRLNIVRNC